MRYAIVIENAGGNYSAYVRELPGCIATGATVEEAEQAIREPSSFIWRDCALTGHPSRRVEYVEVAA